MPHHSVIIPYPSIIIIEVNTWISGHTLNNNTNLVLFNIILYNTYCTVLEDLLPIKLLTGRRYNDIRSTEGRLRLNVLQPKKHGASGNGSKESPDQSKTCFKLIFDHQNMGIDTSCVKVSVILAEIWHKIEFTVMAGHFVPVCHFGQFCQSYPPITGFIMLYGHQNMGIDTSYVEISVILVKQWYKI